ncbi:MAG: hypothetical protein HC915_12390 [Anaerolineae bacterium]|nr:hypothetical protein [Anaerolineae bacterium]
MSSFQELAEVLVLTEGATMGQWFGLPCLKANGYIFLAEWTDGAMIFKLKGEAHARALALEGGGAFPSGAGPQTNAGLGASACRACFYLARTGPRSTGPGPHTPPQELGKRQPDGAARPVKIRYHCPMQAS